jgi:hypothetical protein
MRQFMPFSTLWIVRRATLAFLANCACVINLFSRSSRTRFRRTSLDPFPSIASYSHGRSGSVENLPGKRVDSAMHFVRTGKFFRENQALPVLSHI